MFFICGSLPAEALLDIRILGLFGMICRLKTNIIHKIAEQCLLTESDDSGSWFVHVRNLCTKYGLPSALSLLSQELTKDKYKSTVKSKVTDFWESYLRQEATSKSSLRYFDANFASLSKPHPILTTPASNPYEVNKSVIQLLMISGRYRDDRLMRYWSPENKQGTCKLCSEGVGVVEYYLKLCPALTSRRQALFDWLLDSSKNDISLTHLLKSKINSISEKFTRFVLQPSSDSDFFAAKTE